MIAFLKVAGGFLWDAVVWLFQHPATALALGLAVACWHYRGNAIGEHQARVTAESQRDAANANVAAEQGRTAAAIAANQTSQATIEALRKANTDAAALRADAEQQRARALRDLAKARETIRAAEQESALRLAAIYANDPNCSAWAAAAVCPAVADQLRVDDAAFP